MNKISLEAHDRFLGYGHSSDMCNRHYSVQWPSRDMVCDSILRTQLKCILHQNCFFCSVALYYPTQLLFSYMHVELTILVRSMTVAACLSLNTAFISYSELFFYIRFILSRPVFRRNENALTRYVVRVQIHRCTSSAIMVVHEVNYRMMCTFM